MGKNEVISVREELADGFYVRLAGDIDMSRSLEVRSGLLEIVRGECDRLIVDLTDVPYMDSSGVATLVEVLQHQRKRERHMVLCGLQSRVISIFQIARLDKVFTIVEDAEAAKKV